MNTKELYDHIIKYMTPEQALMKLLEGHAVTYEHLKFKEGEEVHPTMLIAMATLDMGWNIAFPDNDLDTELDGMIVGTSEYIDKVLKNNYECDEDCGCNHDLSEDEEN
jgi:hypothetical protein